MSRKPTIAAVVPMRHTSVRVPGKNYRQFCGRPLYQYIVDALAACPLIDQIVIDTDSDFIRSDALRRYDNVRVLPRPEHLRGDAVPMNDVLMNTTAQVWSDFYLQTHSTNPLLTAATIGSAVSRLLDVYPQHDSLFGVTRIQSRLWDTLGRAVNHNPAMLLRTQDLPPIYGENSCMYLFTRASLADRHNRIGSRPMMFEIDKLEAVDIDEEADFRIAELLYADRNKLSAIAA